jgi:hypothetical protein
MSSRRISKPVVRKVVVGTPVRRVKSVQGVENLNELKDVNSNTLTDNAVLIWDEETEKWIPKTELNGQIISGGEY